MPGTKEMRAMGVLLFTYAKLKLQLRIHGYDASFHPYDWRLGLDELGAQLASRIAAADKPVNLVAHSMGGLVARAAARILPRRLIRKLIMLGTPNAGSFASVQTLRAHLSLHAQDGGARSQAFRRISRRQGVRYLSGHLSHAADAPLGPRQSHGSRRLAWARPSAECRAAESGRSWRASAWHPWIHAWSM